MTADEIAETLRPFLKKAGFDPVEIVISAVDGPPFETLPNASVHVSLADVSPDKAVRRAADFERAFDQAFGCKIRTGYYSAEIGYDDIPEGQALIEIDMLPFELSKAPAMVLGS